MGVRLERVMMMILECTAHIHGTVKEQIQCKLFGKSRSGCGRGKPLRFLRSNEQGEQAEQLSLFEMINQYG